MSSPQPLSRSVSAPVKFPPQAVAPSTDVTIKAAAPPLPNSATSTNSSLSKAVSAGGNQVNRSRTILPPAMPPCLPWAFLVSPSSLKLNSINVSNLTFVQETKLRSAMCDFISLMGKQADIGQQTIAAACVFFHMFYTRYPFRLHSKYEVAVTCLFLAGKTEERKMSVDAIIRAYFEVRSSTRVKAKLPPFNPPNANSAEFDGFRLRIYAKEYVLLDAIQFQFEVDRPYFYVEPYLYKIFGPDYANSDDQFFHQMRLDGGLAQVTKIFINDSYRSSVCLQYPPYTICVACISAALQHVNSVTPTRGMGAATDVPWHQELFGISAVVVRTIVTRIFSSLDFSYTPSLDDEFPWSNSQATNIALAKENQMLQQQQQQQQQQQANSVVPPSSAALPLPVSSSTQSSAISTDSHNPSDPSTRKRSRDPHSHSSGNPMKVESSSSSSSSSHVRDSHSSSSTSSSSRSRVHSSSSSSHDRNGHHHSSSSRHHREGHHHSRSERDRLPHGGSPRILTESQREKAAAAAGTSSSTLADPRDSPLPIRSPSPSGSPVVHSTQHRSPSRSPSRSVSPPPSPFRRRLRSPSPRPRRNNIDASSHSTAPLAASSMVNADTDHHELEDGECRDDDNGNSFETSPSFSNGGGRGGLTDDHPHHQPRALSHSLHRSESVREEEFVANIERYAREEVEDGGTARKRARYTPSAAETPSFQSPQRSTHHQSYILASSCSPVHCSTPGGGLPSVQIIHTHSIMDQIVSSTADLSELSSLATAGADAPLNATSSGVGALAVVHHFASSSPSLSTALQPPDGTVTTTPRAAANSPIPTLVS